MGTKRGLYYVCDRCGKTTFKEETGVESTFTDGNIKEESLYEEAKDWDYIYPERKVMHGRLLCPECGKSFDVVMRKFMNQEI